MEIKEKLIFKIEVKKKIDKFIKEFPIYFYVNILINLSIIVIIISTSIFIVAFVEMTKGKGIDALVYGLLFIVLSISVSRITLKGFIKNVKILNEIRKGKYDFSIEDHEMDNAVEFVEDLPMKKEEVEKMRKSLSYDKIFDVLEAVGIIVLNKKVYDIDLVFKYRVEEAMENEIYRKNNLKRMQKRI